MFQINKAQREEETKKEEPTKDKKEKRIPDGSNGRLNNVATEKPECNPEYVTILVDHINLPTDKSNCVYYLTNVSQTFIKEENAKLEMYMEKSVKERKKVDTN